MASQHPANELHITRCYDAPVHLVWDAWTDPAQAALWWGPRGFTLTTHSKELKPGGIWHYTMHGPDGVDYPNKALYLEVEPLAKLVYDHGGYDDRPPLFRVCVRFSESQGKTTMHMIMTLPTAEAAEQTRQFIKKAGGNGTWDRLGEYLAEKLEGKDIFVINRSFEAPIELLFKMWTQPEHLGNWLPPTGFTMTMIDADIRTGGSSFYSMGNGQFTFYGRSEYIDISAPNRLVFTQQFCDENGQVTQHPGAPIWPKTWLTTVTLSAESPNQTRVTVTSEVYGPATDEEKAAFVQERAGMTQGWTGSFDKLEGYLQG